MESSSFGFVDVFPTVGDFTQPSPGNDSPIASNSTSSGVSLCDEIQFFQNTVILGLICIFGFVGNTISIVVLQHDRHNRVPVFLLKSLAVADNSVLFLAFVALGVFYGLQHFVNEDIMSNAEKYIVRYVDPLGCAAQSCTIWITVLLALNRYAVVCRPFASWKWLTMKRARIQVFIVVTFSVVLNIPRVFKDDIHNIGNAATDTTTRDAMSSTGYGSSSCSAANCSSVSSSTSHEYWYFEVIYLNAFYTSVVLILPLFLLVGFNIPLMRQLQNSKRKMMSNSLAYSGHQENNITFVMIIIILEMVFCHTPDRIIQVIRFIEVKENRSCPHALFFALNIANFLVILNSSTDFIIYYVFRKRFRTILCDLLNCRRPRSNSYDIDASNSQTGQLVRPLVRINSKGDENQIQRVGQNGYEKTVV